jgi:hypothetical protein
MDKRSTYSEKEFLAVSNYLAKKVRAGIKKDFREMKDTFSSLDPE